jgi:MFS family permease
MLAVRPFRLLLAVRLTGQAGDGLFQGALVGATFFNPEKSTSAAAAAGAFATLLLPYSLVGPFAGVGLDRWSRQRTLVVTNVLRALLLLVLAATLAATGPTSAATLVVALLTVSVNRFVLSGLSASLPHVVETRRLVTANAFTTTLGTGAAALGGFTTLALRAWWGKDDTAAARTATVAALVYLCAAVLATRLGRRTLGPDGAQPSLRHALAAVARGLLAGARHVHQRRPASRALLTMATYRFFSGLVFVGTLLLYTPHGFVHRGFTGLGQTLTAAVAGGLLAATVTPRVTRRVGTQPWIVVVMATAAPVTAVLVPVARHPQLLAAGFVLGFTGQAAKICVDTLLQEAVEDDFRGRVFAFYDTLFNVGFVAAAVTAALVLPPDGRSVVVMLLVALGFLLTATTYALLVRRAHEPPEPVRER